MDKREMLDRLAANGDERLLLGRVWDKYEQCRRRNLPEGTGFLSPAEQAAAQRLLNALSVTEGYAFWGGYDGAQRRQLWFLPEWQEAPEEDAVRVVRASFYEEDALTHRDLLGSLMALGLTRETLGDILVFPRWADVLATAPAAELLLRDPSVRTLRAAGCPDLNIQIKYVPGTFELSLGAQFFAEYTDVDAVIVLGCVIQGDTRHFDFVCQGVTQGVMQLQLQWNMPIAFGVLTTNDLQQALDRSGGRLGNKGDEAAAAAIQMVHLQDEMDTEENALDRKAIN